MTLYNILIKSDTENKIDAYTVKTPKNVVNRKAVIEYMRINYGSVVRCCETDKPHTLIGFINLTKKDLAQ